MRSLVAALGISLAIAAGLLALALLVVGQADWWRGLAASTAVSLVAAAVSILPLYIGLRFGLPGVTAGHFIAMALRLIVVLGGSLLLVKFRGYPPAPTLALCVPFYFALLAGESVTLARHFWGARAPAATSL